MCRSGCLHCLAPPQIVLSPGVSPPLSLRCAGWNCASDWAWHLACSKCFVSLSPTSLRPPSPFGTCSSSLFLSLSLLSCEWFLLMPPPESHPVCQALLVRGTTLFLLVLLLTLPPGSPSHPSTLDISFWELLWLPLSGLS